MTILNTTEITRFQIMPGILIPLVIIFILITTVDLLILMDVHVQDFSMKICTVISFAGLLILLVVGCDHPGIRRYEVILDNDYPAVQLLSKYRYIERKGDIWVIQDLEKSKNKEEKS